MGRGSPSSAPGRPSRRGRPRGDSGGGGGPAVGLLGGPRGSPFIHELIHVFRVVHPPGLHERHGLLAGDDLAALAVLGPHAVGLLGLRLVGRHLLPHLHEIDGIGHAFEALQDGPGELFQERGKDRRMRLHPLLVPLAAEPLRDAAGTVGGQPHEGRPAALSLRRERHQRALERGALLALAIDLGAEGLDLAGVVRGGRGGGLLGGGRGIARSAMDHIRESSAGSAHQSRRTAARVSAGRLEDARGG